MPLVTVQWFPGRSMEQKRGLAKAITDAVVEHAKVPPSATTVIFQEMAKDDCAEGGVLISEK